MQNVWEPEVAMTIEVARELIGTQFPELAPLQLNIMDYGFDNTVFQVNHRWVFRFPRREIAVELLEAEGGILPFLHQQNLQLELPLPTYYGKPSSMYPWPFLGYHYVKGKLPSHMKLVKRGEESAVKLAAFMKSLHKVDRKKLQEYYVPQDELARLDVEKRFEPLEKNIQKIRELQLFTEVETLHHYLSKVPTDLLPEEKTLVHGDLHFKNVVVNEEGILSGIIDWGDVHIGHRAVDLNMVYSFLTLEGRAAFFNIYGEVQPIELEYARFKAIYTNVVLLLYGYHENQKATVKEAQRSLELALI
ncbi:phosphotransferase [Rossellomorea aquimaris]|uniref:phosphotransferase n=1 Tax=Rossellomorea aquimaris TaxID=189382 RepID=UPI0007D06AD3|nr:phosphotransferase [Rossellomorea aquimaris]